MRRIPLHHPSAHVEVGCASQRIEGVSCRLTTMGDDETPLAAGTPCLHNHHLFVEHLQSVRHSDWTLVLRLGTPLPKKKKCALKAAI